METAETKNLVNETVYTPVELAKLKKLHPTTIRQIFLDEPGVIRLGHEARGRRRQYFTLRIPESVADRVFRKMTVRPKLDCVNPASPVAPGLRIE